MLICEWCKKEHNGTYGSGRFCCYECKQNFCKEKGKTSNPKQIKTEERICQRCGAKFTVDLKRDSKRHPKRYCSYQCANIHKHTEETKRKISDSIKNYNRAMGIYIQQDKTQKQLKKEHDKQFNYKDIRDVPKQNISIFTCEVCGKQFYHIHKRVTCDNPNCRSIYHSKYQKNLWGTTPKLHYKDLNGWTEDSYKQIYTYYYTYKITNLINGKYYLGIHATNNLDDGYMGSGKNIKQAIKKYGRENFKKDILEYFYCYKDLAEAESRLITEDIVKDKNSYNMTPGGIGGPAFKGRHHTEETKQKLREYRSNRH